jgi:hypothetical protein
MENDDFVGENITQRVGENLNTASVHMFTTLSKKYPTLGQEKKVAYLGGSISNPLQSRPLVTPHT